MTPDDRAAAWRFPEVCSATDPNDKAAMVLHDGRLPASPIWSIAANHIDLLN
jgi:hypothetical protein